jgi:hypothetical protein
LIPKDIRGKSPIFPRSPARKVIPRPRFHDRPLCVCQDQYCGFLETASENRCFAVPLSAGKTKRSSDRNSSVRSGGINAERCLIAPWMLASHRSDEQNDDCVPSGLVPHSQIVPRVFASAEEGWFPLSAPIPTEWICDRKSARVERLQIWQSFVLPAKSGSF